MKIDRAKPTTRHTGLLARKLAAVSGPCIGCSDCNGLCAALIEALTMPELILSRQRHEAQ